MGKSIQEKIGIMGAGNLGTSMALSLVKTGFSVIFHSSHYKNDILNIKNESNTDKFLSESNTVFIAVKDKDIKSKVDIIKNHNVKGKIIIHFSGYHSSDILSELKDRGGIIGSFHPIFSFPQKNIDLTKISEAGELYGSYEGDNIGMDRVKEIFGKIGFNVFEISKDDKHLYHLSLTLISNYPFYIVELGKLMFDKTDIDTDKTKLLNDFLRIATENYINSGKISGPLSRGDYELIESEIKDIKYKKLKKLIDDLIKLSKRIKEEGKT